MKHTYTLDQLKEAIATSYSYRQVLTKLGIIPAGGNYYTLKKRIKQHTLDTSHFTNKGWRRNRTFPPKPISTYLTTESHITSHRLRQRLLREGYKDHVCELCSKRKWLKKPIPLELHHVNGVRTDNRLENLQLLCPNCHTVTDNYRGRGKRKSKA